MATIDLAATGANLLSSGTTPSSGLIVDQLLAGARGLGGVDMGRLDAGLTNLETRDPGLAGQARSGLAGRLSPVESGELLRVQDARSAATPQATAGRGDTSCPSAALTPGERNAAARGDRLAFWTSRAERGDPIGQTALAIVKNEGVNGKVANARLFNALAEREVLNGRLPDSGKIRAEMQQIGVELMRAHARAIDTLGNPSAVDIARYHHQVFGAHGLDPRTFGGTMLTGSPSEANAYPWAWRTCP